MVMRKRRSEQRRYDGELSCNYGEKSKDNGEKMLMTKRIIGRMVNEGEKSGNDGVLSGVDREEGGEKSRDDGKRHRRKKWQRW
jgi:hypothetical protein